MKKIPSIIFLTLLFVTGCQRVNLPRGEVSPEWAAAAESFHKDALSVTVPDRAQPYSMMVVDHGKVVFEKWFEGQTAESKYDVYSVAKTVLALATGLAVEEGLIDLEDKVIGYFPERLPKNVSDTLSSMTIRHLLTMTCGLEETPKLLSVFTDGEKDFDWIREFFASTQTSMPGTQFYYNFFSSYILAAIIEKTSGTGIMDYISASLLKPLHITDMEWEKSPEGICMGGTGMRLCTEDVAKLGQLLLQNGRWNGRQLVPAHWVDTMTSKQVESCPLNAFSRHKDPAVLNDPENDHSKGYGYYVWQGKYGTYRIEGMRGNYAIVSPSREIVLAITSNSNMDQRYMDLIWKHFAHLMQVE